MINRDEMLTRRGAYQRRKPVYMSSMCRAGTAHYALCPAPNCACTCHQSNVPGDLGLMPKRSTNRETPQGGYGG